MTNTTKSVNSIRKLTFTQNGLVRIFTFQLVGDKVEIDSILNSVRCGDLESTGKKLESKKKASSIFKHLLATGFSEA